MVCGVYDYFCFISLKPVIQIWKTALSKAALYSNAKNEQKFMKIDKSRRVRRQSLRLFLIILKTMGESHRHIRQLGPNFAMKTKKLKVKTKHEQLAVTHGKLFIFGFLVFHVEFLESPSRA